MLSAKSFLVSSANWRRPGARARVLREAAEGEHLREGNSSKKAAGEACTETGARPASKSDVVSKSDGAPPPARKEVLGTAQRVIPDRMEPMIATLLNPRATNHRCVIDVIPMTVAHVGFH